MSPRLRRAVIALPVVMTLTLAAALGVLGIVQQQDHVDRVAEADRVAQAFYNEVATFKATVASAVREKQDAEPGDLRGVVEDGITDPPRLGPTSEEGREASTTYRQAQTDEKVLLDPYQELLDVLAEAEVAAGFIEAANTVLGLRATDYVGFSLLRTSERVESALLPAFTSALATFDAVPVPKGQEALAATVHGAVQYVIDQSRTLVAESKAGRNYSFSYADRFNAALEEVRQYQVQIEGEVDVAINAVTADV